MLLNSRMFSCLEFVAFSCSSSFLSCENRWNAVFGMRHKAQIIASSVPLYPLYFLFQRCSKNESDMDRYSSYYVTVQLLLCRRRWSKSSFYLRALWWTPADCSYSFTVVSHNSHGKAVAVKNVHQTTIPRRTWLWKCETATPRNMRKSIVCRNNHGPWDACY